MELNYQRDIISKEAISMNEIFAVIGFFLLLSYMISMCITE
ncbi:MULTISPECIES: hypothetical protein [Mammaliicoccus]|nr:MULTISPECIES: hypothetical protein [Mammaliicoccus]WQK86753.1 hypothetical protein P3U62_06720 [Mammaliicoccus vitulinus]